MWISASSVLFIALLIFLCSTQHHQLNSQQRQQQQQSKQHLRQRLEYQRHIHFWTQALRVVTKTCIANC